jgi:hypothetical protein
VQTSDGIHDASNGSVWPGQENAEVAEDRGSGKLGKPLTAAADNDDSVGGHIWFSEDGRVSESEWMEKQREETKALGTAKLGGWGSKRGREEDGEREECVEDIFAGVTDAPAELVTTWSWNCWRADSWAEVKAGGRATGMAGRLCLWISAYSLSVRWWQRFHLPVPTCRHRPQPLEPWKLTVCQVLCRGLGEVGM